MSAGFWCVSARVMNLSPSLAKESTHLILKALFSCLWKGNQKCLHTVALQDWSLTPLTWPISLGDKAVYLERLWCSDGNNIHTN